jgi:3-methyl-2-oxobutanoate hydroxymethyltransferase
MPENITISNIKSKKSKNEKLVMVTAYDTPGAHIVSESGADIILVGDSVAMVVLGYESTLQVDISDIVHHVKAVKNANPKPLIVADMPWMSYHLNTDDAVLNASKLIKAGAHAVKVEGGEKRLKAISAILDAEIPVMGHLGLTPQSINVFGGFKVQGKRPEEGETIVRESKMLEEIGCFSIVLECVPAELGARITKGLSIPTIGIGAGPGCDGQVLVFHDLLGFNFKHTPRFVRKYADLGELAIKAVESFVKDVKDGQYPGDSESY